MTAARFDLLFLLREKSILGEGDPLTTGIPQRELWTRLDLDKSTISKMLTRLEEMGWVRRTRSTRRGDWRSKMVFATALGLQRIAKAMRVMFRQRTLLSYFERILKDREPRKHVVKSLLDAYDVIHYIADCFGDRSIVCYDFGPQLAEGPWDFLDFRHRKDFHPLYTPPPKPRMPPARKGPRLPRRPFEFTPYENAVRDGLWGDEKRRRQRTKVSASPSFTCPPRRLPDRAPRELIVELLSDPDEELDEPST
jgi:DNA-binding MarR family transcriptional regulator